MAANKSKIYYVCITVSQVPGKCSNELTAMHLVAIEKKRQCFFLLLWSGLYV